ncbi:MULTISPECIES: hypothetical protein [unclassified Clostridium]|uniref:hypothetical protein n=1 Tax=unclassified Clostridium TaxID=2614128 RepID=UPI001C8CD737|nr:MULTISPECIES: hypothetical protein [unclassified Clostridium]MBX9146128.1 hypothetical protein [Clostridium sp. K13]
MIIFVHFYFPFSVHCYIIIYILSTRTIRNYIKLGLLNGSKTNGYWQFTSDDISKFMNNDYVTQSLNTKRNSLIYDYILNDCKSINSVCSIYDYPVENNVEAKSLYNKILKKINSNEYNNLKFSYNYSNNMVRIILIGDPNEINELIMC